ncbi:ROK family protein [Ferrimonas balearica]|uniref:ROK family protein n=1 Tax=Ferrimonas balearica TaxID=44012 RepID=UPI001C990866|nr:ROK family protein [Ferrimonas balearica]MBY5990805.1 ROK family protein [Ferrimonas balearica]
MTAPILPPLRLGVDLGGTKTELVALDPTGQVRWQRRTPTPSGDYHAILTTIAELVSQCERALGQGGTLGVGIPGALKGGRVKGAATLGLEGQAFEQDLAARLGRAVKVANDANCFAVSEATDGAGQGHRTVFGVVLGTGCGAGLVVDGALHSGPNGLAGEWGHLPLPWMTELEFPGPRCFCGQRGCIETFVSGRGLSRQYAEHTGQSLGAQGILERVAAGEGAAQALFERYLDQLARALGMVVQLLDPDCIVLGGGLSNIDRLYPALAGRLGAHLVGGRCDTPVYQAQHGDASGVRGAAWLWGR